MRYVEVKIKLPDWLLKWIEDVAKANEESIDDTIAWLLTQHYNVYERTVLVPSIKKRKQKGVVSHE